MNRLKFLREEKGLFQCDIAKVLGLSTSAIGFYENEKRDMNPEVIIKLANYFGVTTDYLLGKTDIRNTGEQIDDVINESMIGMSRKEYEKLTETQKKQIRDFAIFVKNQNK